MKLWNSLSIFAIVAMSRLAISKIHPMSEEFRVNVERLITEHAPPGQEVSSSPGAESDVQEALRKNPKDIQSTVETNKPLDPELFIFTAKISGGGNPAKTRIAHGYSHFFLIPDPTEQKEVDAIVNQITSDLAVLANMKDIPVHEEIKEVAKYLKKANADDSRQAYANGVRKAMAEYLEKANADDSEKSDMVELQKSIADGSVKVFGNPTNLEPSSRHLRQAFMDLEPEMIDLTYTTRTQHRKGKGKKVTVKPNYVPDSKVLRTLKGKFENYDTFKQEYTIQYIFKDPHEDGIPAQVHVRVYISKEKENKAFGLHFSFGDLVKLYGSGHILGSNRYKDIFDLLDNSRKNKWYSHFLGPLRKALELAGLGKDSKIKGIMTEEVSYPATPIIPTKAVRITPPQKKGIEPTKEELIQILIGN